MFRGTFTALVTPFRDSSIDVSAFEELIEAQINAGITGVVAVGTTGESPTLSGDERAQVIRLAVARANKRCLVLAGTGSNSTHHAIAETRTGEKLGVDAALLVAPYYNKPSQEGLFRHFKAIADGTSLPIMLYNIPGRCGVDILPETVERLAKECRNIVSIKEASGSVERVGELRRRLPETFTILSGDDSLTLPFLSVGAVGVVSVASTARNHLPRLLPPNHPPVTLMWRATAGCLVRRSMMKSWPLGLRDMASSMARASRVSSELVRSGARRSAASSCPRHI